MSTHKNTWKAFERVAAKFFGTVRNALSGRNSKVSSSDSIHPDLYIECKYRATSSLHSLFKDTKKKALLEDKIPVICTKVKNEAGFLITIHSDDFHKIGGFIDTESTRLTPATDL